MERNKTSQFTSLFLILLFIIESCQAPKDTPNCHYKIKIKNNTSKVLLIDCSTNSFVSITDIRQHPIEESVKPYAGNSKKEIGSIHFIGGCKPMCVENLLNRENMYIFLYDSVAIANKNWDEVRQKHLFTKSYKITLKELQKNNFTIEYNGK